MCSPLDGNFQITSLSVPRAILGEWQKANQGQHGAIQSILPKVMRQMGRMEVSWYLYARSTKEARSGLWGWKCALRL